MRSIFFKVKFDTLYSSMIVLTVAVCVIPPFLEPNILGALILYTLAFLMLWIMWFGVKYELRGELLFLHFGPFRKKLDVNTFQQITYTKSVIASAAMAIKRLEILYDNFQLVHISPKDEELFIQKMMEINPKIEVNNKRKNDKGDD